MLALVAEPGAGKSTLVPPFLMDAPWMKDRRIIMLEPRRLAATAIAGRIAELLGEETGRRAGFRVRTARRVSGETRIEVVTEALLTRMIQQDPLLSGVGLVIIDEFHERSIHADLALALALEVRKARPDLALLLMSATLETEEVTRLLAPGSEDAPSLRCPGTSFPVQTRYAPAGALRWEESFADGVVRLFDEVEGDLLAFVPGAGEIRRTASRMAGLLGGRAEVLGLHGMMPLAEQRRIAAADGGSGVGPRRRRVVVSTSIAETSLTVPGIHTVMDAGWSRISRFHPATGLDRLVTERVSQSSADQRRGRAGRLGPGLCVRFWAESEKIPQRTDPEILRSDLSGLVLECALWGAREPHALAWMDAPPAASWSQASETLRMLGLVNDAGPTELGRRAAALGLPPRLSVLVLRGAERGLLGLAAACAAFLEERDASGLGDDPDIRLRLELLRHDAAPGQGHEAWRRTVLGEMRRILRRAGLEGSGGSWTAEEEARVGDLLAYAFADRIARREPDRTYRLVTGRVAGFRGGGPGGRRRVASRAESAWITVPDADAGETTGVIRLAAPVDGDLVESVLASSTEEKREIRWEGLVPRGFLVRRAGRLSLAERQVASSPTEIAQSFRAYLARQGLAVLPWNEATRSLLARIRFYTRVRADEGLGDLGDAALAGHAERWLEPYLKLTGGHVLTAEKLHAAVLGILGPRAGRFRAEVPESITLPSGSKRRIDYAGGDPAVEARIQEVFGLDASPLICGVPLVFRLLSPANRPLQVTRDLAGFWENTYAEVRKEMRGRYPRHYWPEDPRDAQPTSGARPRR